MNSPATLTRAPVACGLACPVCDSLTRRTFLPAAADNTALPDRPFYTCGECGLRFRDLAPEEDGSVFADVELTPEGTNRAGGKLLYLDADVLYTLRELTDGRRLLDVGSGSGRFLAAASRAGFDGTGVDISERLAERARTRSGCPVHVGVLPQLGLPAQSFDVVNLDLVLEFVPDLQGMMREVARLLAPGGVCRVREYFADSVNARLQGPRWWLYDRVTLRALTRNSVERLAEDAGLAPERFYPGTEASWETWRAFSGNGQKPWLTRLRFALKGTVVAGAPLAADGTCYLRKA